jgi:hypothetical protein
MYRINPKKIKVAELGEHQSIQGKFLGNHKRPYLKQRDVAALELATERQLERVILLALSVTLNLLLH